MIDHEPGRRDFLKTATGICFALSIPLPACATTENAVNSKALNAWVNVASDGTVTIASPAAEMGQGSMTAIPMIFAEEFDADWDSVEIEASPADDGVFHNPTWWVRGIMLTLGSSAVSGYYDSVRLQGAQARRILLASVSRHWRVPIEELITEPGVVVHKGSSRRISYGDIASCLELVAEVPEVSEKDLKREDQFRIIGSDIPRYDVPAKTNGTALYSIDIDLPGMLYATVMHSPVHGGAPRKISNRKEVEKITGVLKIVELADAVAVVARDYESAYLAEKQLKVEWSEVKKLGAYSDTAGLETHLAMVRDNSLKGMAIQEKGKLADASKKVNRTYSREYLSDYVYHAQLEPLNAVASVSENNSRVELWAGTQAPTHCNRSVAAELGIDVDRVVLHRTYLGGGFGRRGAQDHDFVIDAVKLSRLMKAPVKVIWSREADVKNGRFKPIKAIRLEAGEDSSGKLITWHHRTASDEALKQSDPYRYEKGKGWPVISSSGMDIDYDIENVLAEIVDPDTGVRAAPLRGIGGTVNKFAGESFIDEIAAKKNIDPLDLRLQLLHAHDSSRQVLNVVADMCSWRNRKRGQGLGMAFESAYYPTACVVETGLDRATGRIQVLQVWIALDVGVAVHPENIVGQVESQVIFTLGTVLMERITFDQGRVEQSNFHDYPVMRMADVPDIHVEIITRANSKPLGVGDSRCEPVPAAVANAFADLTGKRLRHMPFLPGRVLEALSV